jgi:hypothetical protein
VFAKFLGEVFIESNVANEGLFEGFDFLVCEVGVGAGTHLSNFPFRLLGCLALFEALNNVNEFSNLFFFF